MLKLISGFIIVILSNILITKYILNNKAEVIDAYQIGYVSGALVCILLMKLFTM